jgi:hypothetical protein
MPPAEASTVHAGRLIGREDLDDDLAVERDIGREKDPRHATAAELTVDPEPGTGDSLPDTAQGIVHPRPAA